MLKDITMSFLLNERAMQFYNSESEQKDKIYQVILNKIQSYLYPNVN